MGSERYARQPLLYINQMSEPKTNAKMQYNYRGDKAKKVEKNADQVSSESPVPQVTRLRKKESFSERIENNMEQGIEQDAQRKEETKLEAPNIILKEEKQEEKQFEEMSIKEKIKYVVKKPKYAPKLTCEIKTEENVYRGIILDFEKDMVTIQRVRQQLEIPVEQIIEIKLLSIIKGNRP